MLIFPYDRSPADDAPGPSKGWDEPARDRVERTRLGAGVKGSRPREGKPSPAAPTRTMQPIPFYILVPKVHGRSDDWPYHRHSHASHPGGLTPARPVHEQICGRGSEGAHGRRGPNPGREGGGGDAVRRPKDWKSGIDALIGRGIQGLLTGLVAIVALLALMRAPGWPSTEAGRVVLFVAVAIVAVATLVLMVRGLRDYGALSVRAMRRFPVPRDQAFAAAMASLRAGGHAAAEVTAAGSKLRSIEVDGGRMLVEVGAAGRRGAVVMVSPVRERFDDDQVAVVTGLEDALEGTTVAEPPGG